MAPGGLTGGLAASLLLIIICCFQEGAALKTGGSVTLPGKSVTFLTKFCFTFNPIHGRAGFLELSLSAPDANKSNRVRFLLLDDEVDSYTGPSREWQSLACQERQKHAKQSEFVWSEELSRPGGKKIVYEIKQKVRPRWWYIALADCSGGELPLTWDIRLINPDYGWAQEFSTDKRYSSYVFAALLAAYLCLVVAQVRVNASLAGSADADSASAKAAHPFARILLAGLALALGDAVLSVMHNMRFAADGVGVPAAQVLSQLISAASSFILSSLLLLISQGKCVSYIMVAADARAMLGLLGPFLASCLLLEFWGEYSVSQNYTTDYVYTTPFGWALILVDLLLLGLYARNLHQTFTAERDREDGRFYRTWGIVYSLWFLALPITAVLAQLVMAPYAWYMVSISVKKGGAALVYASLVVGLWPGNTQTYFNLKRGTEKLHGVAVSNGAESIGLPWLLGRRSRRAIESLGDPAICKLAMSP